MSLCALNNPCNTSYIGKLRLVQLTTCANLFAKISPTGCLCYTMLNMPINIDKMLEKISVITSLSSFNTAHSCKFTFVLIGEHVVDTFHVHAICVTYDKLADLESKILSAKPSDISFEMKQLLGASYFQQLMLSSCSYLPLKERNHVQSNACAHKSCSPTSWSIEFERYTSKPMNKLCHNNFWNAMNAQHPFDEKLDLAKINVIT